MDSKTLETLIKNFDDLGLEIISYNEKNEWTLVAKYSLGKRRIDSE